MKKAPYNLPAAGASGEQLTFIDPPQFCRDIKQSSKRSAGSAETAHRPPAKAPFEPTSIAKAQALRDILTAGSGAEAATQMRRLVAAMNQLGEVSRVEAEQFLGIGHCCRRIADLSENGYLIARRWIEQIDASGCVRKTVAYSIAVAPGVAA